jgi:hypothetical protein
MAELEAILAALGISQYLNGFVEQGFDSWDVILDITESDLDALGVKLGHRRKLQRKIASSTGLSRNKPLASHTRNTPNDDRRAGAQRRRGAKGEGREPDTNSGSQGAKRRYRWHPKPDENAPKRPPSAYVIFLSKIRGELKGRNLSFTEIAKLVGENWRSLSPAEKESYERQPFYAKERYDAELSEYKKTSQYREYSQYLVEFKARQSTHHQATDCQLRRDSISRRKPVDSSPASRNQWPARENLHSPLILPIVQSRQRRRVASMGDRRLGCADPPAGDPLNLTKAMQHPRRMGKSSISASGSSPCVSSSAFLRTLLEPTLDRTLSTPSLFTQTSSGSYGSHRCLLN